MQILITMGGMVIGEELIKVIWGPQQFRCRCRARCAAPCWWAMRRSRNTGVLAVVVGLVVFAALLLMLNRTKLGLLIRAGVQDREMVESLGYRIRRLFVGVFVAGSALAGLGGVMWGLYQQNVIPQMGAQVNVLIFIVIIIGGLGSTGGCFLGALLVGLLANYAGFLAPKVALFSNILLMVAILLWRPQGIYPAGKSMIARAVSASIPRPAAQPRAGADPDRDRCSGLAFAPFLFPGAKALNVAAKILIFIVLVASYDLLLGYTGIVSFAHTMFFGIGAYGVAIASTRLGPTWGSLALGVGGALAAVAAAVAA